MNQSVCILFENDYRKILLLLRDDKPSIPYPNRWDIPGGVVEQGESPEEAIIREMKEEIELDLKDFRVFKVFPWEDRRETVFFKKLNLDIRATHLHEGQRIRWFTKNELLSMSLAFNDNAIIREYYGDTN